jgi:Uma2 family endonuclease
MPTYTTSGRGEKSPRKMLISVEDYHRMGAAGIFKDKARIELIDGELLEMSPFTTEHNSHVDKANEFFVIHLYGKAKIRIQGSVRLDPYSEPEPDVAVLRFDETFYKEKPAGVQDIHLLIEVAVNSLEKDRTIKLEKYAQAGIPEYWIIIPDEGVVEVYRKPKGSSYQEKITYRREDDWIIEEFQLTVKGSDFLI